MPQRFEHCRLVDTRITYLGRDGIFEFKHDRARTEYNAWDYLEKKGWELVSVIVNQDGDTEAYFKRPVETG